MDAGVFIALINPGMALVFAATFFLLCRHQREQRYIAVLSLSFAMLAGGFLLQYFTLFDITFSKLLSNLLLLVGCVGLVAGGLARYDRKPPLRVAALATSFGFAVFVWFLYVQPSLPIRIYAINFTVGAITLLMAAEIRNAPDRKAIDNLLLGVLVFWGITYFVRPVVVMWIDGPYLNYDNFHLSLYWITMTVSSSLFLLIFPLALVTAITLDVMDELRRESQTDPLSGLLNRRGFEEGAAEALRTARRRQMPAALVVCDLDHFKTVNDTWGHVSGDAVIAAFADCLRGCVGPGHVVGRIGGEEFAVLLQGANSGVGRLFAEGARTAFSVLRIPHLPAGTRLSASFGVAEWRPGEGVSDLFARADTALYQAKKDGRDCVRVMTGPATPASQPHEKHDGAPAQLSGIGTH